MLTLFPSPGMTPAQILGAYMMAPTLPQPVDTATDNPTYVTVAEFNAFKRLWVNHYFKNNVTYVYWEVSRGINLSGDYKFQLQASHAGTPRADDWFDIGSQVGTFFTTDDGGVRKQRMFGKTTTLYYRVKLFVDGVLISVSPIIAAVEDFNKHDWLIVREIVRQEQLNHRVFSSEKGYLLKARRYGPKCDTCADKRVAGSFPGTVSDTNCPYCYGTGFVTGYYPPTEFYALRQPSSSRERRELEATGTTKEEVMQARFLAVLPLVQGDAWVSGGSDERYYIHNVTEAALWKGNPIVYNVELRLAPFTDALYDVPLGEQ